ncbi:MAG: ribosome-binding factor A [Verrucomicrobia bacterium]|nr:ribosome-binding factor A [Verrucomicrobiota bacterium]
MESLRQQKVGRLIQKEVGLIFNNGLVQLSVKLMISVTQVRMSPDLGIARLYLSLFPSEQKKEAIDEIRNQSSEIRYHLGKKVGKQLRHTPELQFYLDDSFDYAEEIDELLKE